MYNKEKTNTKVQKMVWVGLEPQSRWYEACVLPLHQQNSDKLVTYEQICICFSPRLKHLSVFFTLYSVKSNCLDIDRVIIYDDASTETIKQTSNRLNAEISGRWYCSVGLRKFDSLLSSSLSPARSSIVSQPVIWRVSRPIKPAGSKNVHLVIRNTVSKPRFWAIKLDTGHRVYPWERYMSSISPPSARGVKQGCRLCTHAFKIMHGR